MGGDGEIVTDGCSSESIIGWWAMLVVLVLVLFGGGGERCVQDDTRYVVTLWCKMRVDRFSRPRVNECCDRA